MAVVRVDDDYTDVGGGSGFPVTFGTTPADDDLIVMAVFYTGTAPDAWSTIGFTEEGSVTYYGGTLTVGYKVASSEGSATYSLGGTRGFNDVVAGFHYSGADTTDPIEASAFNTSGYDTYLAPSVTTLTDDAIHLALVGGSNDVDGANSGGYTELIGGAARIAASTATIATAGATGDIAMGTFQDVAAASLAIKPAPSTTVPGAPGIGPDVFTDDFSTALDARWVQHPLLPGQVGTVSGGEWYGNVASPGGCVIMRATDAPTTSDVWMEFTVSGEANTGDQIGIILRGASDGSFVYVYNVGGQDIRMQTIDNTASPVGGSVPWSGTNGSMTDGTVVRVHAVGDEYELFLDDVSFGTLTNSYNETEIGVGLIAIGTTGRISELTGGDFPIPDLGTTVAGFNQNQVNWTAPASDGGSAITGYLIERNEDGAGFVTLVADTASTAVAYVDTTAVANSSYTYRVSAINALGTSVASAASTAVTTGPVLFSDDFNRADSASLGAGWTDNGYRGSIMEISGNKMVASGSGDCGAIVSGTFTDDQYAEADLTQAGSGEMGITVRADAASDDAYAGYWVGTDYKIIEVAGGSFNDRAVATSKPSSGTATFRLEIAGHTLTMLVDSVEELSYTDGSPRGGGSPGVMSWGATSYSWDNFSAGDNVVDSFSDDFNRPDENPATGWAAQGDDVQVVSNELRGTFTYNIRATPNKPLSSVNQYVQADFVSTSLQLLLRSARGGAGAEGTDYLLLLVGTEEVYINGVYQNSLSYGNLPPMVAGTTIRWEAEGTTLRLYHDGTQVGSDITIDATYGGTYTGVRTQSLQNEVDNFETGILPGPPSPPTIGTAVGLPVGNRVNWTTPTFDNGSAITGYLIERNEAGAGFTTLVADTGSTATTYEDTTAVNGVSYTYRVSAINAIGTSAASAASNAVVPLGPRLFTDDFNRADNTDIGSAWLNGTYDGSMEIVGNELTSQSVNTDCTAIVDGPWSDDHYAEADISLGNSFAFFGVMVRMSTAGGGNGYFGGWNTNGAYEITELIAGSESIRANSTGNGSSGTRTLRLEAVDNTLTLFVDGVEELSYTDGSPITSGSPGLLEYRTQSTPGALDNFSAGDLFTAEPRISDTFRTISDATNLTDVSGWDAYTRSGTGVMQSDQHTDHSPDQVIDMSNTGYARAIRTDKMLDSVDQTAEVWFFADTFDDNSNNNAEGIAIVRAQSADASDVSGYSFTVRTHDGNATPRLFDAYIEVVTNDSGSTLASSFNVPFIDNAESFGPIRVTLEVVGSTLTGYVNGKAVVTATDTTYPSGGYVGFGISRILATTYSQPFVCGFEAWTPNETNLCYTDILNARNGSDRIDPGDDRIVLPIESPTAGNKLFVVHYMEPDTLTTDPNDEVHDDDNDTGWVNEWEYWHSIEYTKIGVWSKVATGSETEITVLSNDGGDANNRSTRAAVVIEMPDGWDFAEAAHDTLIAANPLTGTLSTKPKIGLMAHVLGDGGTPDFADGAYDRALALRAQIATSLMSEHRFGLAAVDLGTATTAFGGSALFDNTSSQTTAAVIALEYTAPGGVIPTYGYVRVFMGDGKYAHIGLGNGNVFEVGG